MSTFFSSSQSAHLLCPCGLDPQSHPHPADAKTLRPYRCDSMGCRIKSGKTRRMLGLSPTPKKCSTKRNVFFEQSPSKINRYILYKVRARKAFPHHWFSCHRSAVHLWREPLSGGCACRLHPRLCSRHAYGVLSYTPCHHYT